MSSQGCPSRERTRTGHEQRVVQAALEASYSRDGVRATKIDCRRTEESLSPVPKGRSVVVDRRNNRRVGWTRIVAEREGARANISKVVSALSNHCGNGSVGAGVGRG